MVNLSYYERHKEQRLQYQRAYQEANPEKIKAINRDWYEKNKEKYLEKKNQKVTCVCGSVISLNNRAEHLRSKKHVKFTESN